MERDEVALMPEIERDELALIYEAKGMDRDSAYRIATQVMADPERMLAEQVQEELGISESHTSPMREAWITGTATAIGALIPVMPFLFLEGRVAVIVSFAVSMISHWVVGAARSVFTGRSVFRSGMDMFVVGLGVAAVGYYVGEWIAKLL
jgi:vacuolar iron transporter family protein